MLSRVPWHPGDVLNVVQLSDLERRQIKHEAFFLKKKCSIVM